MALSWALLVHATSSPKVSCRATGENGPVGTVRYCTLTMCDGLFITDIDKLIIDSANSY